ncbi:MAG: TonB-dependent receptor [Tenacibaculum sp.]|uniref:TonB-dependent receptor n=1 Tax=Tenacibaculum sp. TaxID=1906242 RepID=UPI0018053A1F|nr:TonB-dependent receptor [Tenacibaculum sp.]NVK09323.1 TonB-dependent receptor [Tenacibaculum sp.]
MHNSKYILIAIISAIFLNPIQAQNKTGVISGRVIDTSTKEPVVFATVLLLNGTDETFIKSEFTEENGKFNFNNLKEGTYRVRVIFDGFNTLTTGDLIIDEKNKNQELSSLELLKSIENQLLDEVLIVAKKKFIERKIDRTVLNVDALKSNSGLTALELLEKSPGVNISEGGSISLRGKSGVTIFIDDRPTYLSGTELENYLNGLSSDVLDKIEIMTNPPAKYEASGNAGIINIKLKKNKTEGENGNLVFGVRQHKFTEYSTSFNFNQRKKKYNFFANSSVAYKKRFQDIFINRNTLDNGNIQSITKQETNNIGDGFLGNVKLGIDYNLSPKTNVGVAVDGLVWTGNDKDNSVNELYNSSQVIDSIARTKANTDTEFYNTGINLNLKHDFNDKKSISTNLDYLTYKTEPEQEFINTISYPDSGEEKRDKLLGMSTSKVKVYSGKVDYSNQVNEKISYQAGVKHSYVATDNKSDYTDVVGNISTPNLNQSNQFLYDENITSAYLNSNINYDRFSLQLGLRYEKTNVVGEQLGNEIKPRERNETNYQNWFPTAYISYKLDSLSNNTVGINYGKRIDRPFYIDLNPVVFQVDKFTFYGGNPFLKPSLTNSIEAFYSYKSLLNVSLSYSNIDNQVQETIEVVDGIYFSKPGNIGKTEVTSLSLNSSFKMTDWLSFSGYTQLSYTNSMSAFYSGDLKTSGYNFMINPVFQIELKKDWDIEVFGYYVGKSYEAQFITKPYWFTDLTVSKKLTDRSSFKLVFTDIFRTNINRGDINNLVNTTANYKTLRNTQQVRLTFSYKFGDRMSKKKTRSQNSIEQEKSRIKF